MSIPEPSLKSKMRIALLLFAMLAALCALPAAAHAEPHSRSPSKLERQVYEWVERLAERKPFQAWLSADPQIEALGPGTHSWLVLFTKEGREVGYMIVHAVTDGSFELGEYGTGPYPLFSRQLLERSLLESGLVTADRLAETVAVKRYVHPFAAAWEVADGDETYWLDAKTAEQLPLLKGDWSKLFPDGRGDQPLPAAGERSVAYVMNEPFDAYERLPWLAKEAPFNAKDARLLQKRLNARQHLRYVIEPFGEAMLYAVPVIGYQRWSNGRIDVAVDMAGTRFLPVPPLLAKGSFYR
ncbi:hypothetical protein ACF3MZ_05515 [Paenibacillaceae bacterium WGS1546]|uniref:hypothetical protein n=1 Tax=Cohnella sp. WGS1546 TaxID=3366810 RepID=UPI00372CE91E